MTGSGDDASKSPAYDVDYATGSHVTRLYGTPDFLSKEATNYSVEYLDEEGRVQRGVCGGTLPQMVGRLPPYSTNPRVHYHVYESPQFR